MAETYSIKKKSNSLNELNTSYESQKSMNKKERKNSINSSSPDTSFNNLNTEIKSIIENETDLSFSSNSNSEINENKKNIELLLDSKFWRASKEINSETDEPISTYESQNEKNTPSKKDNYIIVDKQNSPKPFHSKYAEVQEMVGTSVGSNKQSTQSNEDEEARHEHLHNISYCESNNNSPINSLENNESEENEIKKEKMKINIEDGKNNINLKEKVNNNINNNLKNNNKLFINGFNNYNNLQNLKYNNDSEFSYPYDPINYKNNNIPFFPGVYLPQQLCPFIPNYNYSAINKKNFLINNNNINNKLEDINSSEKNEDLAPSLENNYNIQNNQYIHSYMNNLNNMNNRKVDIIDLPLLLNQNNPQNNTINYGYSKINFICCPQIQPVNAPIQKTVVEKINNSSNYLPEINNKENTSNSNKANSKNASNNINSSNNTNICPVIEQNNNKIKINNKNFIINKNINILNNKVSIKGEKQVLNLDDIVSGKDTRTTVMIRNIPIKYTDEILIEALKEFNGKYDCLYMPYDYEKNGNKGYAFINFINPLHILYFYEKFNGKKWIHFESSKICELNCAHFQGINEIQKHAKNYKGQKKPNYYSRSENNENMTIPSKYLLKLKKRFPKMQYSENKIKKVIVVKSFE
jgi:hypothetical protein